MVLLSSPKFSQTYDLIILDLDNTLIDEKQFIKNRLEIFLINFDLKNFSVQDILAFYSQYYDAHGNNKLFTALNTNFNINIPISDYVDFLKLPLNTDESIINLYLLDYVRNFLRKRNSTSAQTVVQMFNMSS